MFTKLKYLYLLLQFILVWKASPVRMEEFAKRHMIQGTAVSVSKDMWDVTVRLNVPEK